MAIEKKEFQTEVAQLMDIVINSLYSHKEIFLRELISNASDAIDKARYEGLTNPAINEGGTDWKIKLIPDEKAKTLTISDNGIGMTKEDAITALGTIAHSGTKQYMKQVMESTKNGNVELIGQFGVGFYSAFMVADKVTVISRKRGQKADTAIKWESTANGSYTIENTTKDSFGTDITLHLKDDEHEYLKEWELRKVVKSYSDYIEHPVVMDITRDKYDEEGKTLDEKETKEEVLNSQKALWLKDKSEITKDEYTQFYRHISNDFAGEPAKVINFKAEGTSEFTAMLFIPTKAPFNILYPDYKVGPTLYVKRVQIMDNCEQLMPMYLRFVKGVVDSSDLPLNISREILQNNRQINLIQKNITKKVLDALGEMKRDEYDKFVIFTKEFGRILKEGLHYDPERKNTIADLLLFESTHTKAGEYTSLEDYINRMKSEQKEIYYITGAKRSEIEHSPYLESLKAKGYEVLFMTDDIDDIVISSLFQYKEKPFKSVFRGDLLNEESDEKSKEKVSADFKDLLEKMKTALNDKVSEVRISGRLKESAVCLVGGDAAIDPYMEKMLKSMGQKVPESKKILEINPDHPLLVAMKKGLKKDKSADKISDYANLLYQQAILLEGGKLENPADFVSKITSIMAEKL